MLTWTLHLNRGFRLEDPSGREIEFVSKKAAAVLAYVALSGEEAVSRDSVEMALWPSFSDDKRSMSLRRCLSILRKELGKDSPLHVSRTHCWLDWEVFRCPDARDISVQSKLVPEFNESWFQDFRSRSIKVEDESSEEVVSLWLAEEEATEALKRVIEWAVKASPRSTETILASSPVLVENFGGGWNKSVLSPLLPSEQFGWVSYTLGVSDPDVDVACDHLKRAEQRAMASKKWDLYTRAITRRAKAVSETDFEMSIQLVQVARNILPSTTHSVEDARLKLAQGWIQADKGKSGTGIANISEAIVSSNSNRLDLAEVAYLFVRKGHLGLAESLLFRIKLMPESNWKASIYELLCEAELSRLDGAKDSSREAATKALELSDLVNCSETRSLALQSLSGANS